MARVTYGQSLILAKDGVRRCAQWVRTCNLTVTSALATCVPECAEWLAHASESSRAPTWKRCWPAGGAARGGSEADDRMHCAAGMLLTASLHDEELVRPLNELVDA
jgi:hypothetical protein